MINNISNQQHVLDDRVKLAFNPDYSINDCDVIPSPTTRMQCGTTQQTGLPVNPKPNRC